MIPLIRPGDLVMIYGAGSAETERALRSYILGFLDVEARPIRDFEKASKESMSRKIERGWRDKWTFGLPVRRAWRTEEKLLISQIATTTYRAEAGQAIGVWGALMTEPEAERALKIRVTEVSVFGEPPVSETGLTNEPFAHLFRPSRAFPGSFGERVSLYEDGETRLYLTRFEGDGTALLGRPLLRKDAVVKVGVSGNPIERVKQLNEGFPPAAIGKWGAPIVSEPYSNTKAAEAAEQTFKNLAERKLESLGGEFFRGDWTEATLLFANIPGVARFGP